MLRKSTKIAYLQKEWVKFGKKYNKIVDKEAVFLNFIMPPTQDRRFGRMWTQLMAEINMWGSEIAKLEDKKALEQYVKAKEEGFLLALENYFEDMLEKIKSLKELSK